MAEMTERAMAEEAVNEASYLIEDETADVKRVAEEAAQDAAYQVEDDETVGEYARRVSGAAEYEG